MIEFKDVSKVYDNNVKALSNVNIKINSGDFVFLVGPSVEASPKEIRRRVPMVLSLVGLSHKYKMFPNELSGGEQQRVSLARAIVNNPAVLIADEPTGNLDPETAKEIMDLLEDINRAGTTILMATHAKDIVDNMQKRVIAIDKGTIVRDDRKGMYENEN